jgi:uncharacterized cupin superfamily protein
MDGAAPHLVHWDDVPWESEERGDMRWKRQRLGRAAGSAATGLSRFRMGPGDRCMPVHVHVDEEEFVVALAGAGLSWQDGAAYAVGAGDAILHRADAEAHTLLAGADGLEVLIFGGGSATGLTRLPRAGVTRVGDGWVPADAPAPFEAEAAAGPLPVPEPAAQRPPTMRALEEVLGERTRVGRTDVRRRNVGEALGSAGTGLRHIALAAGAESHPAHCHSVEEETFVVVEGGGDLLLGWPQTAHELRPGHVVARPPGTREAHAFRAGPQGLALLAHGTRDPGDLCFYPRSGKVSLRGVGVIFRPERLDYWEGEE